MQVRPTSPRSATILAVVLAAVALVHAPSLRGGLVLDARALVADNPRVQTWTADDVAYLLTHDYWQPMATDGLYRPATTLSFLAGNAVAPAGDRALVQHALNVALHLGVVALVHALAVAAGAGAGAAGVAAALFGLHPATTEVVANVAGRADLLAALGVLAGLLCHVRGRDGGAGWTLGLAVALLLGLGGKETGLVLPAVVIAWDVVVVRRPTRLAHYVVLAVGTALYVTARTWVARNGLPPQPTSVLDNPLVGVDALTARLTAVAVLARYAALAVWPATLSADYSFAAIRPVGWPPDATDALRIAAVATGVALAATWAWRARRRTPVRVFLLAATGLALLPASNLLVVIGTIMGERALYLPLAFATVLLVDAVRGRPLPRAWPVVAGLVLLACAARTVVRIEHWRDELALWSSAVRAQPDSAKAQAAWARALVARGTDPASVDAAIAAAERALAILPDEPGTLADLGGYYVLRGDREAAPDAAAPWYARAVDVLARARALDDAESARDAAALAARGARRTNVLLYNNLSLALARAGRLAEARDAYAYLVAAEPSNARRYVDRSAVDAGLGRWDDAAVALWQAVTLDPRDADAVNRLGEVYRVSHPAAIRTDARGASIDGDEPLVRMHRCRALAPLVDVLRGAGRSQDAAQAAAFVATCPPG